MKSFEKEMFELANWLRSKSEMHDEAVREAVKNHKLMRDGDATYQWQLDVCEYNHRLVSLKQKYGMPIEEKDRKWLQWHRP